MGRMIASLALQEFDAIFSIVGALEAAGHDALGSDLGSVLGRASRVGIQVSDAAKAVLSHGDVLIEFTTPEVTLAHVKLACELRKPMVIGTTGLREAQRRALKAAAKNIPIVFSPNMSVGVNLIFELAEIAAQRLGSRYDVEVIESHHRHKKDAPSGTAKRLIELLALARKQKPEAIVAHAIRAGDIVGDHTVIFAGPAERIELTHRAHSREVFAQGALKAAQFVVRQKPGLYDMSDVLRA
jgi:4-hydroxy-tetrahydrodipicolinate reductase